MPKTREQLKREYVDSLDSFITQNPKVGQLDTAKFRDFLIGLVEHESGFNPTAKQGSYFGWYQTNKLDSDPYKQHVNAFNHLNELFNNTITKADIQKAHNLGISDAALMLKYWNQGNRVNNYLWNNKDSADGLGTKISNYGNDLTMPLDVYAYAMDNISGKYIVKNGDNWFNIQKRVRIPGRDYATGGKDLWGMYNKKTPFGLLKVGQEFTFQQEDPEYDTKTAMKVLPSELIDAWKRNPEKNHLPSGYTDDNGNWHALKSVYHKSWGEEMKEQSRADKLDDMLNYGYQEDYVSKYPVYKPFKHQKGGLVYTPFIEDDEKIESDDLYDFITTHRQSSFPVEPVKIQQVSSSQPTTVQSIQQKEETPSVETPVETPVEEIQQPVEKPANSFTERESYVLSNDGTNKEKRQVAIKYLQQRLSLSKEQAAALVGIWQAESGFNLNAENKAEKAGKNSAVKSNQYGIGIGQWTHSRHDDYVNYTKGDNSLRSQLDFAANEIETNYQDFLNNLRSAKNIKDAVAYAYIQYVGGNEKNIKDITDLYARVNRMVNRYRKKHLELYGRASNGFEQRLKFAIESLNLS